MQQQTQTEIVTAMIEYGARGSSNKEITQNILKEWRNSQIIQDMKDAEAYSLVKNTAIDKKTRDYFDEDGHLVRNENMSNVKSKTSQYRKSLYQKLNFALNKPFVLSCDNDKYKEAWDEFLSDETRDVITACAKNAINKGIGFVYPFINEEGQLELVNVDSKTVYPAWNDEAHTKLDAVVRDYKVVSYNNTSSEDIYKVEFWDKNIVEKYIDYGKGEGSGNLEVDNEEEYELTEAEKERTTIQQTHLTAKDGTGVSWEKVPFIYMKGIDDELPLLNEDRTDIDNYDLEKSKLLDSGLDDIDATMVIEGISAEMGELSRARKLIQNSRIVSVDTGCNAHFEKVNVDVTAGVQTLDLLKKDFQDNTNTVNVTTIEFGSNPSGKAMRTFYLPLNEWANGFEKQFRVFFKNLKYFFDRYLSWVGGYGTFEELQNIKITATLDRDMVTDETEIIQNIVTLGDEISQETRLELNPYVEDVEREKKRLEEDKQQALKDQELFGFQQDVENNEENTTEKTENQEVEEK